MAVIVSSLQPGECYILYVDSTNGVSLYPEWDYARNDKKVENTHYTRSGRRYNYIWAVRGRIKFSVEHVDSSTAAVVNSWWASGQKLLFKRVGTTDIMSCQLVNRSTPIGKYVEPYMDELKGVVELETY
jgi:hypothetical protein